MKIVVAFILVLISGCGEKYASVPRDGRLNFGGFELMHDAHKSPHSDHAFLLGFTPVIKRDSDYSLPEQ